MLAKRTCLRLGQGATGLDRSFYRRYLTARFSIRPTPSLGVCAAPSRACLLFLAPSLAFLKRDRTETWAGNRTNVSASRLAKPAISKHRLSYGEFNCHAR